MKHKVYGVLFADGRLYNRFVHTDIAAADLLKFAIREAQDYEPRGADTSSHLMTSGTLPAKLIRMEITYK